MIKKFTQKRANIKYILLGMIILFLLAYSCKKEINDDQFQTKSSLIAEAKSYFEDEITPRALQSTTEHELISNGLDKLALWEKAKTIKISIGDAVVVPIKYRNKIAIKPEGGKDKVPLEKTSYLMVYRDLKQNMQAEWVTLAPMGEKKKGKFVGILSINKWMGNFKRGFAFGENGVIQAVALNNTTYRKVSTYRGISCISVTTYEYAGVEGHMGLVGTRVDTYCFDFDNDWTDDGGGDSGGDGGGPAPEDYTKALDCAGVPGGTAKVSVECQTCIGGTTGIDKCPSKNPCDESIKLAQDTKFKQLFTNLKNQVTDNKEHGYMFTKDTNGKTTNETTITGLANTEEIEFNISNKIDGYVHSHYTGSLPVFSFTDLEALAIIYKDGNMNNPLTFTVGVVTASDTQYLLFIDDLELFKTFVNNITRRDIHDNYEYLYRDVFKINTSNSTEVNEKGLLQFLNTNKSGLALMKGTDTFDSWERKTLSNNNTVTSNPCK